MEQRVDVAVVGGGAAGIMAALSVRKSHPGLTVAIIDRTHALGRKILVCGAGRCNVTNIHLKHDAPGAHYRGAPSAFIESVFSQFGYDDIISFFRTLGVELYVERKTDIGKLFPVTDQAKTVTSILEAELADGAVGIHLSTRVVSVARVSDGFMLTLVREERGERTGQDFRLTATRVILATGGKTYPALGSDGSGYALAEDLGHAIVEPVVSAVPLVAKNPLSQVLQGSKMEMAATSVIAGRPVRTTVDDVMFTEYGLSGPAILNISRDISIRMNRDHGGDCAVSLNFFPGSDATAARAILEPRWVARPRRTLEQSLYGLFPNKVAGAIVSVIGIPRDASVSSLTEPERQRIATRLTSFVIPVSGTRGWNEGEFTAGGVASADIDPVTLESRFVPGLYFAGEVIDVDGDVGGYNLSWAWCSGAVAGRLGRRA